MPELPEVEMVRRSMEALVLRARVGRVWRSRFALRTGVAWARRTERVRAMVGASPGSVRRRGKYLLWELRRPERAHAEALLIHLGMSGRVQVVPAGAELEAHTHLRVFMEDERELRFVDPRRFGGVRFGRLERLLEAPPLGTLGPEPLDVDFDGASLQARAGKSRRMLRDLLLDQSVVAGMGNIYVLEALFDAGLHPETRASRLRPSAWDRLARACAAALRRGIEHGGTTLRDYRDARGEAGSHQHALMVYGRGGSACHRCGAALEAWMLGGRTAVRCPRAQPVVRGRWVP